MRAASGVVDQGAALKASALIAAFLFVGGVVAPSIARAAGQRRFAVVVGANRGEVGEVGLLFAERDAARMADVLTRFAGVEAEDIVLLRGAAVADVERVLAKFADRVRGAEAAGQESLVYLYYSGHADAQAMHLGSERLPFDRTKALLDATGARLRVMVVDACRSGELTRSKGAVPAEPFEIDADDRLSSEGTAVITSSAAGEDAQESDRLRGGVFTHHFVTGLLGAADASDDQRVTLSEAYRYAYLETLRTTSRARSVQHPTYSFQIRGREDLVLTRLTATSGLGRLALDSPGTYMLLPSGDTGGGVAELTAVAAVRVLLEPGDYVVRRRTDRAVYEGTARVVAGQVSKVRSQDLRQIPYGMSVRKGYSVAPRVWAITSSLAAADAWQRGLAPVIQGALGLRVEAASATFEARLRFEGSGARNADVDLSQYGLGVDVGALKLLDVPGWRSSLGFGLRLGVDGVFQTLDSTGDAPNRLGLVARASPLVRWEWALPSLWEGSGGFSGGSASLALEMGADIVLPPGVDSLGAVPVGGLSWTMYLP